MNIVFARLIDCFNYIDLIPLSFVVVICWGIRRAPPSRFFDTPLNKHQGAALRGVFALVVMLFHLAMWSSPRLGNLFPRFIFWGSPSVAVFLGLSGYGLAVQSRMLPNYLNEFWHRRLAVLLPPYVFISVLYIWQLYQFELPIGERLQLQLGFIAHGWYVAVLLGFYAMFYIGLRGNNPFPERIAQVCLLSIGYTFLLTLYSSVTCYLWCSNGAFFVGLILGAFPDTMGRVMKNAWWPIVILGIVVAFANCLWGVHERSIYDTTMFLGNALLFTGVVAISWKVQLGNFVLKWLGAISYELYLVHGWVMRELLQWWPERGGGYVYAVVIVSLAMASALHWCFVAVRKKFAWSAF